MIGFKVFQRNLFKIFQKMLHHEISGKGDTLVFIHGFMENLKIWKPFFTLFSATHQVLVIDLPGHGKSQNLRSINTMEDFAEDVIEVLDYHSIKKATFIGHSMGGYTILALADIYPNYIKNLILVNSTSLPDSKEKKEQRLKVIPTVHRNFSLFVKLSVPMLFSEELKPQLQQEIDILKNIALETSIEGVEAALKGMRERPDRTSIFYDSDFPILIINGTKDTTIDVELFKTIIPNQANIKVENLDCGHAAFIEREKEFVEILTNFI